MRTLRYALALSILGVAACADLKEASALADETPARDASVGAPVLAKDGPGNANGADGSLVAAPAAPSACAGATFGTGSDASTSWTSGPLSFRPVRTVLADGSVVAAIEESGTLLVRKWHADGTPDSGFGTAGETSAWIASGISAVGAVIPSGDKLLVAARCAAFGLVPQPHFCVARLNANGELDRTFDGDGIAAHGIGASDSVHAIAVDAKGRIVVGGNAAWSTGVFSNGQHYEVAFLRLNPDGSLDPTFGGDGKVSLPIHSHDGTRLDSGRGTNEGVRAIGFDAEGGIVAAAWTDGGGAVFRLNADGTEDTKFGVADLPASAVTGLFRRPSGDWIATYDGFGAEPAGATVLTALGAPSATPIDPSLLIQGEARRWSVFGAPLASGALALIARGPDGTGLRFNVVTLSGGETSCRTLRTDKAFDVAGDTGERLVFVGVKPYPTSGSDTVRLETGDIPLP